MYGMPGSRVNGTAGVEGNSASLVMMENVRDMVSQTDLEGTLQYASPSHLTILGYEPADLVGKRFQQFVHPEDLDRVEEAFREGVEACAPGEAQLRYRHADGHYVWAESVGNPLFDENGRLSGAVFVSRDITERRKAEEVLGQSKERAELLYRIVPSAIFTVDSNRVITSWNLKAAEITGYSESEVVGKQCLVIAESPCKDRCGLFSQDVPKPIVARECVIRRKDGEKRIACKNAELVTDPGGNIIGGIESFEDITESRAATRRLEQAVADLEAIHETALSLNSAHDLDGLLRRSLQGLRRLTGADYARIVVLNDTGITFVMRAELGGDGSLEVTPVRREPGGLSRAVLEERRARFIADVEGEGAQRSSTMADSVHAYAAVPLLTPDRLVGILYLAYNQPHPFPPAARQLVQIVASHAAVAIANAQMFEDMQQAAVTDALTRLPNHRHLMDRLDYEIARATRSGHPFSVMMIDIDDFKLVNDVHGHTMGDRMLRQVADLLRGSLRTTDIIGRYGGDEFLALLPDTDQAEAQLVAARLLSAVSESGFQVPRDGSPAEPSTAIPMRISAGVATYPYDSSAKLELVSLADTAMYSSKRSGGNSVTVARTTDSDFVAVQNATFGILEGLINAVDAKDRYTKLHSEMVARYVTSTAEVLGLGSEQKRTLRVAGLLHDVGKIGIPDRILRKPGPLSEEEREVICQHPMLSEMIIRGVPQLAEMIDAVRHHHERYDGTGYPRRLKGEEIPLMARLIAVADAYSAMTLDRPYRQALSPEEAIRELRRSAGTQLDPGLVEAFIQGMEPDRQARGSDARAVG